MASEVVVEVDMVIVKVLLLMVVTMPMVVVVMVRSHEYLVKCLIETPLVVTTRESSSGAVTRYTANYYTPPGYQIGEK